MLSKILVGLQSVLGNLWRSQDIDRDCDKVSERKVEEDYVVKVEIYTLRTCPFCIRAKKLLDRKGVTYTEYRVDGDQEQREIMVSRGSDGKRSVPQIFINDRHIPGGCDGLYDLDALGQLDSLLSA